MLLGLTLLAMVCPLLLELCSNWPSLVAARIAAFTSVELLLASPGLDWVKLLGVVLLAVLSLLTVSGIKLLVCGTKFSALVSVTIVTLSSVEFLLPFPGLGRVPVPGMMFIGALLSGGVPWTVIGEVVSAAVFACAGTCVGGPGELVACCAVVGFRCDLTYSRASVHSLLKGVVCTVAPVLVFWFVLLVLVLSALGLLA